MNAGTLRDRSKPAFSRAGTTGLSFPFDRLPRIDYSRHPAYGGIFGSASWRDRVAALVQIAPALARFAAADVAVRLLHSRPRSPASPSLSAVAGALRADG